MVSGVVNYLFISFNIPKQLQEFLQKNLFCI